MIITQKVKTERTFFEVLENGAKYAITKECIDDGPIRWIAVQLDPVQDITNTELGQQMIAYCQQNQ